MSRALSIADTRAMTKTKIEMELGARAKELEKLCGWDHASACEFLSSVMNLGIAAHEKWHNKTND